jgi:rod shape-determining protein MreC
LKPKKHFYFFLFVFAAAVLLMTYQSRMGPIKPFGVLSYPLNVMGRFIVDVRNTTNVALRMAIGQEKELRRLKREIRELKTRELIFSEMMIENERLAGLLEIKERQSEFVAAARVVSRGSDRWSSVFVIDKGSDHLVEKDMVVVTPHGLLGKVMETTPGYSRVLLIDDNHFSAAVRLQKQRTEAVLSGNGRGRCLLKYVVKDISPEVNETVVTSGLDDLFPPGIAAGYITGISTREEDLFHEIKVVPFVDTSRVEEVIIIKR